MRKEFNKREGGRGGKVSKVDFDVDGGGDFLWVVRVGEVNTVSV